MSDDSISLNKYISQTGICSRREADKWIESNRVKINGIIAIKGNRVFPSDKVLVDDAPLLARPELVYLALNKPPGITCTTDLKDPDNIIDFMDFKQRIFPIGRLDKASTGLILLTNDGDIVNKILRVEHNHEKEYIVKVNRKINKAFVDRMQKGIPILGTVTNKCKVEKIGDALFRIILTQGLNRQIRRMCEFLDYRVVSLNRIRVMNIVLSDLRLGEYRILGKEELQVLQNQLS